MQPRYGDWQIPVEEAGIAANSLLQDRLRMDYRENLVSEANKILDVKDAQVMNVVQKYLSILRTLKSKLQSDSNDTHAAYAKDGLMPEVKRWKVKIDHLKSIYENFKHTQGSAVSTGSLFPQPTTECYMLQGELVLHI